MAEPEQPQRQLGQEQGDGRACPKDGKLAEERPWRDLSAGRDNCHEPSIIGPSWCAVKPGPAMKP